MKTRTLALVSGSLLMALAQAVPAQAPAPAASPEYFQTREAMNAEIIRRARSQPRASFTVIDAHHSAVKVTFMLDSRDNIVSMSVDRDASFELTPGGAPIALGKDEMARKGDAYWDGLYAKVLSGIRYSMLLGLT